MTLDPSTWALPAALGAVSPNLGASAFLLLILWVTRTITVKLIRARSNLPAHVHRRWISTSRNVFLFLMLLGLVFIWAPQLRTFALSLTAVAIAIVVATKEMILCVSGSLMRASTRAFAVGDWIEVSGVRGEVLDHTLLATTLQEFQPNSFQYTGNTALLPNSVFFTSPIRNLTVVRNYTFHSFAITTEPTINLPSLEGEIIAIIQRHYGPHREEAARANAQIVRRSGVDIPNSEIGIRFSTTDIGKARVTITLFCPTHLAEALEYAITREVISQIHAATPLDPGVSIPS